MKTYDFDEITICLNNGNIFAEDELDLETIGIVENLIFRTPISKKRKIYSKKIKNAIIKTRYIIGIPLEFDFYCVSGFVYPKKIATKEEINEFEELIKKIKL